MVKKILISLFLVTSLFFPSCIFAETVVLKSGKIVEGKIIEKTDKYIKIDFYGVPLTYFFDEIESVDGVKVVFPSAEEKITPQNNNLSHRLETTEYNSEGEYYNNKEYGIRIWHPKDWEVFDKDTHTEVFRTLLATKPPEANADVICVLSCGKDWDNLEPIIMIAVQQLPNNYRDLSIEDLAKLTEQNLRQSPLPPNVTITEYPAAVTINGNNFMKYQFVTVAQGFKGNSVRYNFVKDTKLYLVGCTFKMETRDAYKTVFDKIVGSLEVF